jgi:excisionase family DNA binding protein
MKQRMSEITDMITPVEAAQILGVSKATVYRLIRCGAIPSDPVPSVLKRPRSIRVSRADVERLKQPARPAEPDREG